MNRNKLAALALSLAASASPAFAEKSAINLRHQFFEIPDASVTVEACTSDKRTAIIHGVVHADKTEMNQQRLNDLPVNRFRQLLQYSYTKTLSNYKSSELKPDDLMPGFKDVSQAFTDATRVMKNNTKVTMVFIPRSAVIGGYNPNCPLPPK